MSPMKSKKQSTQNSLTGHEAETLLREYEKNHLDQYYKSLPSIQQLNESSGYYLLAAYDTLNLKDISHPGEYFGSDDLGQTKFTEEGFTQACRWLSAEGAISDITPNYGSRAIKDSFHLLVEGAKYARIADYHMMYGRGIIDIRIDQNSKSVFFDHTSIRDNVHDIELVLEQTYDRSRYLGSLLQGLMSDDEVAQIRKIIPSVSRLIENGHVIVTDLNALQEDCFKNIARRLMKSREQLIPAGTDLDSFTIEELTIFWTSMISWCLLIEMISLQSVDSGIKFDKCMSTQVMDKIEFAGTIERLTGIARSKVDNIVERLSFDASNPKSDIFLQPFLSKDDKIAWSTRLIGETNYQRNMLKLMSRTDSYRGIAANIIGARERALLGDLGKYLEARGFAYKLLTEITLDELTGDIDLLAWNKKCSDQILIIEFKANLPPDEINEVNAFTEELIHGQSQIEKCITILTGMQDDLKREIFRFVEWEKVRYYFGINVSYAGLPNL